MMELVVIIGTLLVLIIVGVVLSRQGNPEHPTPHDDHRRPKGPTGEVYPTGSRPAGPDVDLQTPDAIYGEDRRDADM